MTGVGAIVSPKHCLFSDQFTVVGRTDTHLDAHRNPRASTDHVVAAR